MAFHNKDKMTLLARANFAFFPNSFFFGNVVATSKAATIPVHYGSRGSASRAALMKPSQ
jgi:hypothetical protein